MAPLSIDFHGHPAVQAGAAPGPSLVAARQGGQILSWQPAGGGEQLYLSPLAARDGRTAIRGGVPVCFPQFNRRGPLPKHGIARNLPWQAVDAEPGAGAALACTLGDDAVTRAVWPEGRFAARIAAQASGDALHIDFSVANTGDAPWTFTFALHTYLRVADVTAATLHGLGGAPCWDAVRDVRGVEAVEPLTFGAECDRVYAAPPAGVTLAEPGRRLAVTQSATCPQTVVWNPGPALCATLADLPPDGWRHLLCVEAAAIDQPMTLAPGATWHAWQRLALLP